MNTRLLIRLGLLLVVGLSGAVTADGVVLDDPVIQAVNSPHRLERDLRRDPHRHPEQILHFFEVGPGQSVLDLFSGGGYYTELLARVVGDTGKVVAHNNQAYLPFAQAALEARQYQQRLPNVERLLSEADDLDLAPQSFDRIFYVLGFHDMYYHDKNWPEIDDTQLLNRLFSSLKPGGYLAIIDHQAAEGAGLESAQELHRLSKTIVIAKMTLAGFVLVDSSDVLVNSDDPLTLSVFDKVIRGRTSRYVLKFTR